MQIVQTARESQTVSSESAATVWSCNWCGEIHMTFGEIVVSLRLSEFRCFVLRSAEVYAESATLAIKSPDIFSDTGTVIRVEDSTKCSWCK